MKKFTLLLSAMLLACATNLCAETEDVVATLTFTKACGGSGTDDKNNAWTVTSDANESTYDGTKGIHYGTSSVAVSYLTLTNSTIAGTITKIVVKASGASQTSAKLDVTVGGATFGSQKSLTATATEYTFEGSATGTIVVKLSQTSTKKALYVKSVAVTYSTVAPAVATPVFTAPDGAVREDGTFGAAFDLTISCETDGASVYYTLDGTDPKESATKVLLGEDGKVAIPAATTRVRAIATDGNNYSAERDVTYTFDLGYVTSIADFIELAPTKAYELRFTAEQEAVIIGATSTNLYIQDNSGKGLILYCGYNKIPAGAVVGTKIVGSLSGAYTTYNGQPQMNTPITWADGVQFVETSRPTPVVVEAIDVATYNAHPMVLVKIEGVTFASTNSIKKGDATYKFYGDQFGATTGKDLPESTTSCDITGILINYDGTPTIYPVEASDIDTKGALAELPTFNPAGGATQAEATETSQVTMTPATNTTVTINGDTYTAAKTFNITDEYVEMQVTAKHDFYTDNSTTVWYKAVPSITVEPTGDVAFGAIRKDADMAESAKTLTVTGTYLAEAITATLSDGAAFTLDVATLPAEGGKLTITPVATVGANEAVLTLASGKYTAKVNLSATIQDVYTITWSDKGETFATTTVVDGDALVLPATAPTCSTKEFMGWTAMEDIPADATAADMKYVTTATIPTADATYRAVFAKKSTNGAAAWQLVTAAEDLKAGDKLLMASTDKGKVAADIPSGKDYLSEVSATFEDGICRPIEGALQLTLGGTSTAWTLANEEGQLLGATEARKVAWASGTTTWTITIAKDNNATIQSTTNNYGRFLHNVTSNRFSAYSSATNISMLLPQLYKWGPTVTYSEYSFTCSATPSDIESVSAPATAVQKTIENGQLVIIRDGVKYNAMGVRLQ